ncbi:MAG: ion transporter [Desulfobacteraceae bacterium]
MLAIIPTYVSLFLPKSQYLLVIRILRILRIFRILKLVPYLGEARLLMKALRAISHKITIFIYTVMTLVVIFGSLMYIIEGGANGFTSIPRSIYWAIVTLTTVGYGDISPQTVLGKTLASMVMILGYAIIAVPTGIVSVEMSRTFGRKVSTQVCPECSVEGHDTDARHCKFDEAVKSRKPDGFVKRPSSRRANLEERGVLMYAAATSRCSATQKLAFLGNRQVLWCGVAMTDSTKTFGIMGIFRKQTASGSFRNSCRVYFRQDESCRESP